MRKILCFTLILFLFLSVSEAVELEGQFEYIQFKEDKNDTSIDQNTSFMGRFKGVYENSLFESNLGFFGRYDSQDEKRSFVYPEDTYIRSGFGDVSFYYGTKIYNFSSTEAFHPADGINSKILTGNLSQTEKIGEPVASVDFPFLDGDISLMYFPAFLPSRMPGEQSRLGTGLDLKQSNWLKGDGSISDQIFVPQFGARITQTFGGADLSLHALHHIDRQSPMIAVDTKTLETFPLYGQSVEVGGTYQSAFDSGLVVKGEAIYKYYLSDEEVQTIYGVRSFQDYTAAVLSLEYGLSHELGSDSTFILEGQGLFGPSKELRSEIGFFTRDVLLGYRLALNDANSNELFAGLTFDLERKHEYYAVLDYTFRISSSVKFEMGLRYIDAPLKGTKAKGLEILDRDSSIFTNFITYY